MLRIDKAVIERIIAHARKEAPLEACGYLAEKDGVVVGDFPLTNADASEEHYSLKPDEQFAALRQMRVAGVKLRAVYHSHPRSEARPSAEDIRLAYDSGISHVIISLMGEPAVNAFRIKGALAEKEEIEILKGEGGNNLRFYDIPASLSPEIDALEKMIQTYHEGGIEPTKFRAHRVPFGIYEQRTPETYMTRIRCTAGGITPEQFKTVALLSERYGGDWVHITTRQELQLHDVLLKDVPAMLRQLLEVGLSTRGGGGNTVRNITASWDAGIAAGEPFDVTPYAVSLTSMLISEPDSWTLPRKFKISFANTDQDNAHSVFNDVGFIANLRDGVRGFKVYVAGGMGIKPETGHLLHDFIPAGQVYRVAEAVKKVFDRYGNRKNKHAARLRFLWNKIGEAKFRGYYEEELQRLGEAPLLNLREINNAAAYQGDGVKDDSPEFSLWKQRFTLPQRQAGLFSILVPVPLGNLPNQQALQLAELLMPFGENVLRCTKEQNLSIRNIPEACLGNIFRVVRDLSDLSSVPRFFSNSVACTGASTCKLGICLPRGALSAIHRKLKASKLDLDGLADFRLNISGCPNTCGAHMTADLGFYGQVARKGQRMYPSYGVVAGARIGAENPRLAVRIDSVSSRDLPDFVRDFLDLYLRKKDRYRDVAHYIDEDGPEDIREICDKYRDIPDFQEDRNYYFDWGAEEVFSLAGKGVGECSAGLFDLIDVDLKAIKDKQRELEVMQDQAAAGEILYHITLSAARMLLITRGIEAQSDGEVFDSFIKYFANQNLVDGRFRPLLELAASRDTTALSGMRREAYDLAEAVEKLYDGMDDSLKFQPEKEQPAATPAPAAAATIRPVQPEAAFKDFRGVACPMNFVKTKMELAKLQKGQLLRIFLDDGEPIDNVPLSVAEEGHKIIEQAKVGDYWSVLIERH